MLLEDIARSVYKMELEQAGSYLKAKCPLEVESVGKYFLITPTQQRYYCFNCGRSGDKEEFEKKMLGKSLIETKLKTFGEKLINLKSNCSADPDERHMCAWNNVCKDIDHSCIDSHKCEQKK